MSKKKILLITPPYHCGVLESSGTWLSLAFLYLAGSLRKAGYEVEIYDAMSKFHNYGDIGARLEASKADFVATTAFTATINDAIKTLRLAKEINPSVLTVLGGVHPTFCWQEILEQEHSVVDYVIRGEGELTTVELLQHLSAGKDPSSVPGIAFWRQGKAGKAICTQERSFITDLDSLPTAWDLIEWGDYTFRTKPGSIFAVVSSSRGCIQRCSFCSQQLFWKRQWRARSPENFVSELKYLNQKYNVNVAMITDEVPTLDRKRWERILDLLIADGMDLELLMETRVDDILRDKDILHKYREAGVIHIYVGVESAKQEILDRFHKNIKIEQSKEAIELINEAGIISETSLVLGMPEETPESIRATVKLAQHYNPDLAFFLAIAPWPYSDIYPELKPFIEVFDYSKYNLVEPVVKPIHMTREELSRELSNAFRTFYMGKLSEFDKMSKSKRDYMIAVTRALATDSCLAEQMKGMGKMPRKIRKYLAGDRVRS